MKIALGLHLLELAALQHAPTVTEGMDQEIMMEGLGVYGKPADTTLVSSCLLAFPLCWICAKVQP